MKRFVALLMLAGGLLVSAESGAAAVFTIEEVGSDIRVTASGTLNLTGLTLVSASTGPGWGVLDVGTGAVVVGPPQASGVSYALYNGLVTGPSSFGSGSYLSASSTTSPSSIVGFAFPGSSSRVYTPVGFVSGSTISGTSTYTGQTFSSLGLTSGSSYTYTLPNDTITIQIGSPPSAVPTLSEWSQMLLGLLVMTLLGWHFHRQRLN